MHGETNQVFTDPLPKGKRFIIMQTFMFVSIGRPVLWFWWKSFSFRINLQNACSWQQFFLQHLNVKKKEASFRFCLKRAVLLFNIKALLFFSIIINFICFLIFYTHTRTKRNPTTFFLKSMTEIMWFLKLPTEN